MTISSFDAGLVPADMEDGEDDFAAFRRTRILPSADDPDWIEASEGRPHPHDNIPWANGAV